MRYEVRMTNGDCAEADSIVGILNAAATLHDDDPTANVHKVFRDDAWDSGLSSAAAMHVVETTTARASRDVGTDLAEDR